MNDLVRYAGDYTIVLVALYAVKSPLRKHVEHLQELVRQLGGTDVYGLRCECCHRKAKREPLLTEVAQYESGHTTVRVWHSDRPRCSAAFATDPAVLEKMIGDGK